MKISLYIFTVLLACLPGVNWQKHFRINLDDAAIATLKQKKQRSTISCSPDWATYFLSEDQVRKMIPLPGTGDYKWHIQTTNDSAQFYFNQGINLYYGFHIVEALPSFKKAQLFDPTNAMLYWAEALAYGPNINDAAYSERPEPLDAARKARALAVGSSAKEKALIDAMLTHYSDNSSKERSQLNENYLEAMKNIYRQFPKDADVAALYADAIMNMHPWDIWEHNGKPKPWTPELISVLENILKTTPDHPGANHYYIHTMEAGPFAQKATASAEKLGRLTPGLAHMVHMPSHIYIRTGQYKKGVSVNVDAIKMYNSYQQLYPDVVSNAFIYDYHNRHMQAACSMNSDNYEQAIADATDCEKAVTDEDMRLEAPFGNYLQYIAMTPQMTYITFGKWDEIMKSAVVDSSLHFASLIQNLARGLAYANTGQLPEARIALSEINSLLEEPDMAVIMYPFNAAKSQGTVAKYILEGAIYEKENKIEEALESYRMGVATEDSLVYQEPRDWLVPARHFLGNALLKANRMKEAAVVFQNDMKYQPGNYTSILGLRKAKTP